jgi:Histidine kinase-like ATPase domain
MSRMDVDAARPHPEGPVGDGPGPRPPAGALRRRLDLSAEPGAVTVGRHFTRQALSDWNWLPDPPDPGRQTVAADILLVVSELIANASLHAGGPTELIVGIGTSSDGPVRALRLEVVDSDPTLPVPRSPHSPGLPGGHGLYIVERLSDRWGVVAGEEGKTVWAEVDVSRLDADLRPLPLPVSEPL